MRHALDAVNTAFHVYVSRPKPIQKVEDCEKMHCYEHPEHSECRGLCRRRAEIKNVERVQLRASGRYRSPRHVDDLEIQRAIAERDKPPPVKCTFRACKEADMRNHLKDLAQRVAWGVHQWKGTQGPRTAATWLSGSHFDMR
eukprot:s811_g8.t1